MKECYVCNQVKVLDDFYKHPNMADGRVNICKECHKHRSHLRLADPETRKRDNENKRKWHKKNNGIFRKKRKQKFKINFPEKYKAQTAVSNAVRDGRLGKASCCQFCDSTENICGHHEDYSKPLEVVWLCARCHNLLHQHLIYLI